ncbi:hypothetical protein K501DRAFT_308276 [Backusella circina FSU 941]|nr:hypothetical protein K501DRAFT_308276 [Backusella circina FSU 941]
MKLNYLLTGLSFILVQYATSAFPMSNGEVTAQSAQLYKREHSTHLVKRKKHNRYDDFIYGKHHDKHRKHNPYNQQTANSEQDGFVNPRYFKTQPETSLNPSFGNPYPATDLYHNNPFPMSVPNPISSVNPVSNSIVDPSSMNGATPAGLIPNSAPAVPAAVPAAVPNINPDSEATVASNTPPTV